MYYWFCFSGLNNETVESALDRLALCPACVQKRKKFPLHRDVHRYDIQQCASSILSGVCTHLTCSACNTNTALKELVPDFLMSNLNPALLVSVGSITFDPETDLLGFGGEGAVYRGKFGEQVVAVKQSTILNSYKHYSQQVEKGSMLPKFSRKPASGDDSTSSRRQSNGSSSGSHDSLSSTEWMMKNKVSE